MALVLTHRVEPDMVLLALVGGILVSTTLSHRRLAAAVMPTWARPRGAGEGVMPARSVLAGLLLALAATAHAAAVPPPLDTVPGLRGDTGSPGTRPVAVGTVTRTGAAGEGPRRGHMVEVGLEELRLPAPEGGHTIHRVRGKVRIRLERDPAVPRGSLVSAAGALTVKEPYPATLDTQELTLLQGPPPWVEWSNRLNARLTGTLAGSSAAARQLTPALTLGEGAHLDAELKTALDTTGLTHLSAVSGSNCVIVLGVVMGLARLLRLPGWASNLAAGAALVGFVVLVRAEPSVVRASVMAGIGLWSAWTGKQGKGTQMLLATVILVILADPEMAHSYGFALSCAATAAIVAVGHRWATAMAHWIRPDSDAESPRPRGRAALEALIKVLTTHLAVSAASQLACTPILLVLAPGIPLNSLPANLLAEPAVAPVTLIGLALVFLPDLAGIPVAGPALTAALDASAGWIAAVATTFAHTPATTVPWPQGLRGAGTFSLLVLATIGLRKALHRPGRVPPRPRGARMRPALLLAPLLGALLAAAHTCLRAHTKHPATAGQLILCDVGQGDAILLPTAPREAVLVDTGPDPEKLRACLEHHDIHTIDTLVISHYHADHVDGLPALANTPIHRALLPRHDLPSEGARAVAEALRAHGTTVEQATRGMTGSAGKDPTQPALRWEVLWPAPHHRPANPNDASVVLTTTLRTPDGACATALLTGDAEQDIHARLAPTVTPVDILKVAHHGSKTSGPRLTRAAQPLLALISLGKDNSYRHPHPDTLDQLHGSGARVLRTDESGHIRLTPTGQGIHLDTQK